MKPAAALRDDAFAIFLFHGVIEEHRHAVRNYTRKHIDRRRFRSVLEELRAEGTSVSMEAVVDATFAGQPLPPRAYAITFDDGFANNLTVAAPELERLETPATFYITTSFVEHNAMSWIDRIEWCFENKPKIQLRLPWRSEVAEAETGAEKIALLSEIRQAVKADATMNVENFVQSVFLDCGAEVSASDDPLDQKLTWHEVRELASQELF